MEVKRGYGFQGVVQYDDIEDKIQCHICGKWFQSLGGHLHKKHGILSDNYRMDYGLSLGTPLCGSRLSNKQSIQATRCFTTEKQEKMSKASVGFHKRRRPQRVIGGFTMQVKNSRGLCDLQMKSRYEVVKRIVKREPSSSDILKYDRKLSGVIWSRGTLNQFRKSMGISTKTVGEWNSLPDLDYVAALRKKAREKKRVPCPKDFPTGCKPCRAAFYKHFGSWHSALRVAGLK